MTKTESPAVLVRQRSVTAALKSIFSWQMLLILVAFVLLAMAFNFQSDGVFLAPRNLTILLKQAAVLGIVAGGVAVLIIMSQIDLSIGSAVYLVGVTAATAQSVWGASLWVTILIALGTGLILGAWQGFWVAGVGVPSFIVTLAGLMVFRGIGLTWTEAQTVAPLTPEYVALSETYISTPLTLLGGVTLAGLVAFVMLRRARQLHRRNVPNAFAVAWVRIVLVCFVIALFVWVVSRYLGTPLSVIWMMVIGFLLWMLMGKTVFGRNAYMIGANRDAASLAGIPVKRHIFAGFVLMGLLYGVAGILFTARLNASTAGDGNLLELDAIAAAVIGGVALAGGKGRIPAVLVGALLLTMIDNGMSVMGVSSFMQQTVKGLILLLAVAMDVYFRNRTTKKRLFSLPGLRWGRQRDQNSVLASANTEIHKEPSKL